MFVYCFSLKIGQCIEVMVVSGKISAGSFKLHKTCQSGVYTKYYYYLVQFSGMLHCWLL